MIVDINNNNNSNMSNMSNMSNAAPGPSINPSNYPSVKCPKCGGCLWTTSYIVKDIPGIILGDATRKIIQVPLKEFPVITCSNCGELAPFIKDDKEFMKVYDDLVDCKAKKDIKKK